MSVPPSRRRSAVAENSDARPLGAAPEASPASLPGDGDIAVSVEGLREVAGLLERLAGRR